VERRKKPIAPYDHYAVLRHCGVDVGKQDFLGGIPMKMT
jgi:hypothetical protein